MEVEIFDTDGKSSPTTQFLLFDIFSVEVITKITIKIKDQHENKTKNRLNAWNLNSQNHKTALPTFFRMQ